MTVKLYISTYKSEFRRKKKFLANSIDSAMQRAAVNSLTCQYNMWKNIRKKPNMSSDDPFFVVKEEVHDTVRLVVVVGILTEKRKYDTIWIHEYV